MSKLNDDIDNLKLEAVCFIVKKVEAWSGLSQTGGKDSGCIKMDAGLDWKLD